MRIQFEIESAQCSKQRFASTCVLHHAAISSRVFEVFVKFRECLEQLLQSDTDSIIKRCIVKVAYLILLRCSIWKQIPNPSMAADTICLYFVRMQIHCVGAVVGKNTANGRGKQEKSDNFHAIEDHHVGGGNVIKTSDC